MDVQETGLKGIKEAVLEVRGRGAYGWLRFESGVHRVQRVPVTESSGRIHTSTATVAVLPEVDDVEVEVKEVRVAHRRLPLQRRRRPAREQDQLGDPHHARAHRARRHLPGRALAAAEQGEGAARAQVASCTSMEQERQVGEVTEQRRSQVGTGDRAEKIRTYNFPDSRITDHRIGLKVHDLEGFLGRRIGRHAASAARARRGGTAIQVIELYNSLTRSGWPRARRADDAATRRTRSCATAWA